VSSGWPGGLSRFACEFRLSGQEGETARMQPIVLAVLCSALVCADVSAQSNWQTVVALQRGTRVRISPQQVEGAFQQADENRIVILEHGKALGVDRVDIQRIEQRHDRAKQKTLVGFLAGWAVGTLMWRDARQRAPVFGLGTAGFGALIGFADGASDHYYRSVFEAVPSVAPLSSRSTIRH
jgi:hypothetical protein